MNRIMSLSLLITGNANGLRVATVDGQNRINNLANTTRTATQQMRGDFNSMAGEVAKSLAAAFTVQKIATASSDIYRVNAAYQGTLQVLKASEGAMDKAIARYGSLSEMATQYGVDLVVITQQYGSFIVALKDANVSMEDGWRIFENFVSATSGLSLSQVKVEKVFTAIVQMASKGVVSMEELRGQLGDSLPSVLAKAAKAMDMELPKMMKLVSEGKVNSIEFIKAFSQALKESFPPAFNSATQSANRLENAWHNAKIALGDNGFVDGLADSIDALTKNLNSGNSELKEMSMLLESVLKQIRENPILIGAGGSLATLALLRSGHPIMATATALATVGAVATGEFPQDKEDKKYLFDLRRRESFAGRDMRLFSDEFELKLKEARDKINNLAEQMNLEVKLGFLGGDTKAVQEQLKASIEERRGIVLQYESWQEQQKKVLEAQPAAPFKFDPAKGIFAKPLDEVRAEYLGKFGNDMQKLQEALKKAAADFTGKTASDIEKIAMPDVEKLIPADIARLIKKKFSKGASDGLAEGMQDALDTATEKYQLPAGLLQAVAKIESSYRQFDVGGKPLTSSGGAIGTMQVIPYWHPKGEIDKTPLDKERLKNDAAYNIDRGAQFLASLIKQHDGDLIATLQSYNASSTKVKYAKDVLTEFDKINGGNESGIFASKLKLLESQQQAAASLAEAKIDQTFKQAEFAGNQAIEGLRQLKDEGKKGITQFYVELSQQQVSIAQANVDALKAKLAESVRQQAEAIANAAPEDLPTIQANFKIKQDDINQQIVELEAKIKGIPSTNLIDARKEQRELNAVIAQAKAKIAELNGDFANNPVAIKAKFEIENADKISKLRAGGESALADKLLNLLTANEQASIYDAQIAKIQNATQAKAQNINVAQESGLLSQFAAQQNLRDIYNESADAIDNLAQSLGDLSIKNDELDALKTKFLEAKNAAAQLRLTIPSFGQQLVTTTESSAIASMADNLGAVENKAKTASQAFKDFGLSVVHSLQEMANQQLAKSVFGFIFNAIGNAISGGISGGMSGLNVANGASAAGFSGIGDAAITVTPFSDGGLITGAGTGTSDSINRRMRVGSYILKANAVKALGTPFLDSLRALSTSTSQIKSTIPTLVSHGEYEIPPDLVSRLGLPYFEQLNRVADAPAKFASGGVVGGKSAIATVGDNVTVNVNTTVNESSDSTVSKSGKFDHVNAFSEQMKSLVKNEIVQQLRNGGELAKALRN